MNYNCVAFGCRNSVTSSKESKIDCKFLNFPLDQKNLTDKWLQKLNLEDWTPGPESLICEEHFSIDSFEMIGNKKVLKPGTVPNIFDELDKILLQYEATVNGENDEILPDQNVNEELRCRICASFLSSQDAIDIYSEEEKVILKILTCIPILVKTEDYMPKFICRLCLSDLNTSYRMLIRAIESEKFFNSLLNHAEKPDDQVMDNDEDVHLGESSSDMQALHMASDVHFVDVDDVNTQVEVKHHNIDFDFSDENIQKQIETIDIDKLHDDIYAVVEVDNTIGPILDSKPTEEFNPNNQICDLCNVQFVSSEALNFHTENFHNNALKCEQSKIEEQVCAVFVCPYCSTVCESMETLNDHLETHIIPVWQQSKSDNETETVESETNICKVCSAVFPKHKELTQHYKQVHNFKYIGNDKARKYTCKECGKVYKSRLNFTVHERVHTGARPYICENCGMSFRSRGNLIQHNLIHSGEKRYTCSICNKAFARKSFVNTHMRIHTGERPYKCDICGHRFTQVGDMRRHLKRHNLKVCKNKCEKKPKTRRKAKQTSPVSSTYVNSNQIIVNTLSVNDFIEAVPTSTEQIQILNTKKLQSRSDGISYHQLISDKNQPCTSLSSLVTNNTPLKLRIARDIDIRRILVELQQ